MLRRDAGQSVSFFDGFRSRDFFHVARGFLPFLAVMLLAVPQLAFAQGSLSVTVHPRTLPIAEGSTGTYTVVLDAEPAEDVKITVVGAPSTDAGVADATISVGSNAPGADTTGGTLVLTFTAPDSPGDTNTGNWSTAQTVTVTTGQDDDAVSETMTLTHTATIGDDDDAVSVSNVAVRVTVNDDDVANRGVTVTPTMVEVDEAGTPVTYSVQLGTEPTAPVTVDIGGASGEVTVSPSRLIFMPEEWTDSQTLAVQVYAGEDADAVNDTVTLTHTVRGGDYTGEFASSVEVTVDDNDDDAAVSVTVAPNQLTVAVNASGTYTVQLSRPPTSTVTVRVSETSDHLTVSPSSLSFSPTNWAARQVTARVLSGATNGDTATIDHTIETTAEEYDPATVTVDDVTVTFSTETRSVSLSPSSFTIDEGASRTYTVRLSPALSAAGETESVTIAGFDGTDLTVAPAQLDFNFDNGVTSFDVMVTADEDSDAVQDSVTLTHTINSAIVRNGMLRVTVRENDSRGVTVTPTSLEVNEDSQGTYTVVLDSEPTGDVTVSVSGASGDVTVNPSQLSFNTTDWFQAKPITVTAAADADGISDPAVTLRHTVRGADYAGMRADNVTVTVQEKDSPGITVDTTGLTLPLAEGAKAEYTVALDSQPTGTVTVMVRGQSGDVTVNPSSLTFTTSNWSDAQEVEVSVGEDPDGEDDAAVTLTHVASGGGYNGVSGGMVTITTTDNDLKGVTATPRSFTVEEGGSAISYNVFLKTEPKGTVTVTVTSASPQAQNVESLNVTPTSLNFRADNWYIPQGVTVRAAEDSDSVGGTVTLTNAASGGGYDGLTALPVLVEVVDDDEDGLSITPTSLQMAEGSRKTYTVVLQTQPPAPGPATVTVDGGTGVSATPATLDFTLSNWNVPRTVTVHATENDTEGDATPTISHAVTGYGSVTAGPGVAVTVKDNDTPSVVIDPTSLTIPEGGSDTYSVVLTKRPTATVNVEVSGATGDITVNRTRLSFSTSSWNREQIVTVSVAEDDDAIPDPGLMLSHSLTGADEYTDSTNPVSVSQVMVSPTENDTRGVTLNPTTLTLAGGVSGTYRVRLNTEPTDDVTIMVNSDSEDVTVSGSPLVFTPTNWRSDQTVTVMVADDAGDKEPKTVMLSHLVTGGDYSGVEPASVTVVIPVEGTPSAPTGLTATGGNQQVTLSWGTPASDGGTPIVRYEYRVQPSGQGFTSWATVPGGASAGSYTVTGLENGTSYTIEVRAVNGVGGGQPATASASLVESAPGTPTNLTATAGSGQVALSWGAPADGGSEITRYEYRYAESGSPWSDWATADGAGNARSVTIDNLTNGTLYGFQVRAVNNLGEGEASQVTATPGSVPGAPTNLAARSESETITVTWGEPADDGGAAVRSYQLRYRMNGSGWSNWMTVNGAENGNSYTLTGLSNGIGHEIEVRAVNAIGSGPAASVEATPMEGMDFAHFANGPAGGVIITSDIVLVNVETSAVSPAIYFYDHEGEMIDADSVVDLTGDLAVAGDGALTVTSGIPGRGEMTISTHGEGDFVRGSVRVFGTGRLGGVLRFDIPAIGVAGVGASEPVSDAIFPVRRMVSGINTGVAVRNLSAQDMTVTCMLMQGGQVMDTTMIELPGDGQNSQFIDEMFPGANTVDFVGSVRCTAADGGMFVGVALELDAANGIFTTLPVVSLDKRAGSGESTLNFAHFANGDFGGTATTSDLVFVNVANSAVTPAIHFFDQMGNMIDASMVVDAEMDGVEVADGALMVTAEIAPLGEMTISTSGMGDGRVGSVRVVSDGPIGGVLRFDIPGIGVAGVGASEAMNAAIYPARRMTNGINTGAAIRNLMSDMTTVTCRLMAGGVSMGEAVINLPGNGQNSQFINELFPNANTNNFEGTVRCIAPSGSTFTGVALEMDFNNGIFTTLPVVPVR